MAACPTAFEGKHATLKRACDLLRKETLNARVKNGVYAYKIRGSSILGTWAQWAAKES
jgi:hypothetical protein